MTDTIPHAAYEHLRYLGVAGPAGDLDVEVTHAWQQQYPDWKGRDWRFYAVEQDSDLMRVEPVNIAPRAKDPR